MSNSLQLRGLASRLFSSARPLAPSTTTSFSAALAIKSTTPSLASTARCLSTTTALRAGPPQKPSGGAGGGGKKDGKAKKKRRGQEQDPKIVNMLRHFSLLSPRRLPPPLRMARNRHLRHWTIHRGWLLFRRRERDERERTLMRQYQSMHAACEALRLTDGPGLRPEGYLYRVAMEKKGVYGLKGVPIEYARPQTETPAKTPWNHDWKA